MHPNVYEWVKDHAHLLPKNGKVLEIGSLNVNGGVRDLFRGAVKYTGINDYPGPGVDLVVDAATWIPDDSYDIVVSTEVLEHAKEWRAILNTCWKSLRPGGWLILTCASTGRQPHGQHGAPNPAAGEWYANVSIPEMHEAMCEWDSVTIETQRGGVDLVMVAKKTHKIVAKTQRVGPLVSCLCPTYNRVATGKLHLLEEAVESFLRQDYANRELIVLSDAPGQMLVLPSSFKHVDAWRVRIINMSDRITTLGEKYNRMIQVAAGDLLMPWEDDDISLPKRVSQAVEHLGDSDYWKPPQVWFLQNGVDKPVWKHPCGIRHHASIFTRRAWIMAGKYPAISGPQDAHLDSKLMGLRHEIKTFPAGIGPDEWQYVYRWGVSDCHVSGSGKPEEFYEQWGKRPVAQGVFKIAPRWKEDYSEMCLSEFAASQQV